jgi:hypothetical protein
MVVIMPWDSCLLLLHFAFQVSTLLCWLICMHILYY